MNRVKVLLSLLILAGSTWALPLGSSARTAIPSDIQQLISVDYRSMKNSNTAMALKAQVLPESLKQFEAALKGVGIDPEKDVDQLTFASYRMTHQPFIDVPTAIEEIRAGRMIVVVDDEDRENEGDFICAAECVTPEIINFMATHDA